MGWYARQIFPRLMDWLMRGPEFQRLRASLLAKARGDVLEIGFGTGLNLPHYPTSVTSLSIVDPAAMLPPLVARRIAQSAIPVHRQQVTAEALPFRGHRFDTVVSTWTLCTIPDPVRALQEIQRVLKPSGRFLFLEHGRSDDPGVAAWQDRLNPIQNLLGCGCHLNRRIDRLIEQTGLTLKGTDRFLMEGVPRFIGQMYRGRAVPAGSAGVAVH